MATNIKLNALLSLPEDFHEALEVGRTYTIEKPDYRIMPLGIPMELSDANHKYLAKVVVEELRAIPGKTFITFKVLKLFTDEERKVYTENFISPD